MKIEPFLMYRKDEGGVITLSSLFNIPELSYSDSYRAVGDISYENKEDLLIKAIVEELNCNGKKMCRVVFFYSCIYKNKIVSCGRNEREWIEGCFIDNTNVNEVRNNINEIKITLQNYFKNKIQGKFDLGDSMPFDYRYLYSNYMSGKNDDVNLEPIEIASLNREIPEHAGYVVAEQDARNLKEKSIDKDTVKQILDNLLEEKGILSKWQIEAEVKKCVEELMSQRLVHKEIEIFISKSIQKQMLNVLKSLNFTKKHAIVNTVISVVICIAIILLVILR